MSLSRWMVGFRVCWLIPALAVQIGCSAKLSPGVDPNASNPVPRPSTSGTALPGGIPSPSSTAAVDVPGIDLSMPLTCNPGQTSLGGQRAWRLTREQLDFTLSSLLGTTTRAATERFPKETATNGFLNNSNALRIREGEATQMNTIARELAADAVKNRLATVFGCDASMLADAGCQQSFVQTFGEKAFRRPLTPDETARYTALFQAGLMKQGAELGIVAVLEAMLQSPNFLFRSELGAPTGTRARLDPYEIASALSYALTNSPPDALLLAAARSNELGADDKVLAQARRLMALPLARPAVGGFFRQLFHYPFLDEANKNPQFFPSFVAQKPLMQTEAEKYFEHVVFEASGTLETLLTADYTFANSDLATLYGITVAGTAFEKVMLLPNERAGVLGLSGVMSTLAVDNRTSPVARGMFIRERLLCATIPDPPAGVDLTVADLPAGLTARQQLDARTQAPECTVCHALMNPLGFAFEKLDAIGRFRDSDNSLPIDDSGEFRGTQDLNGPFRGPVELAQKLAVSEQVRQCLTLDTFRYVMGRAETLGDACAIESQKKAFSAAGHDLKELWIATLSSEAFLYRSVGN